MSRRLARLATVIAALVSTGVVAVTAAAPPAAAACPTIGHVYLANPGTTPNIKFETDPIDGPFVQARFPRTPGQLYGWNFGGNGIKGGTTPAWDVYINDVFSFTLKAHTAGSNCVANEKTTLTASGRVGEVWKFRVNYDGANSGAQIRQQNHFQVTWF